MNDELSKLISLQEVDVEIKRIKGEIASHPERQQELERQFAESVSEYLNLKQQLDQKQADKKRFETDLDSEQQKHQKFKADLMKAVNEKEYTTAVREIDVARKAISQLETEVLKLMEQIEKLETQVNERAPEMEARRIKVDRQLADWSAAIIDNQKRLESLTAQRLPMLDALSPLARSEYERLSKMKSGLALAEARNYSCQACRMTIRPQVFNDIRRGESIIMCENCQRILYFKAEPALT